MHGVVGLVARRVVVLDVIVHERSFVEALHGDRDALQRFGERRIRILLERAVRADGEKGAPTLACAREPATRDPIRLRLSGADQRVQARGRKPRVHLAPDGVEIHAIRAVVARQVNDVPHPLEIHVRVDAVVLEQRDRHTGNGRGLHEGEGPL